MANVTALRTVSCARSKDVAADGNRANRSSQMETEPMGLQFGLLTQAEPTSGFVILRGRDRATLAVNPFRGESVPLRQTGVAMITGADEAVAAHQRLAEALWRDALRGPAAAAAVREMIRPRPPFAGWPGLSRHRRRHERRNRPPSTSATQIRASLNPG